MTEDRLLHLIEAYGADPLRWPEEDRIPAQTLLAKVEAHSPALQAALANARALDALLDGAPSPTLSSAAWEQLKADAVPQSHGGLLSWLHRSLDWPGPLWQPAGALGLSLLFGAWLGFANIADTAKLADITLLFPATSVDAPVGEESPPFTLLSEEDSL